MSRAPLARAFHHSSLTFIALASGDTARTVDELERATTAGEFWPSAPLLHGEWLHLLRTNPRMQALVRRVGLDAARLMALRDNLEG